MSSALDERGHRSTDEHAAAGDDVGRGFGRRPSGDGGDGRPRRLGFETAPAPAGAEAAVGLHDDVTDVAGVARGAVGQAAVEDDPATHAGRDHHGQEVPTAPGRPHPALAQGQGLGVVVQ